MGSRSRVSLLFLMLAMGVAMLVPTGVSAVPIGKIEGEVLDALSTDPIEEVDVCAIDPIEFEFVACDVTDSNGKYQLGALADGSYVVEFWAPYLGYVTQYFNDEASFGDADEVVISGGSTAIGVDAEMDQGGTIEGRVTDAATSGGIEEVWVCAFSTTAFGGCGASNSAGDYAIKGVATGSYTVEFSGESLGYETRFYNEKANEGEANLVSVVAPETTSGINARLSKPGSHVDPPAPTPTAVAPVATPKVFKPKPKLHCRKGFKKVKRHGRKVCVKKHKKKHHKKKNHKKHG